MSKKVLTRKSRSAKRKPVNPSKLNPEGLYPIRIFPGFDEAYERCRYAYTLIECDHRVETLDWIRDVLEISPIPCVTARLLNAMIVSYGKPVYDGPVPPVVLQ